MDNFFQNLLRALSRAHNQEQAKGNHDGAQSILLIVIGIFLLPIPIIGLPLIIWGIVRLCSGGE